MGSPETCPTCGSNRRDTVQTACMRGEPLGADPWHSDSSVPADDASGAEAWAYAIVDRDGKYQGIVSRDRALTECIVRADNADDLAGAPFRVVPLVPLPARDDAVVQALRDMIDLYTLTRGTLCIKCMGRVPAPEDHSVVRSAAAALRREKGGA